MVKTRTTKNINTLKKEKRCWRFNSWNDARIISREEAIHNDDHPVIRALWFQVSADDWKSYADYSLYNYHHRAIIPADL